jgi:hypothetical protein
LQATLAGALPAEVVGLVNVIYDVEMPSKRITMDGSLKKNRAIQMMRGGNRATLYF